MFSHIAVRVALAGGLSVAAFGATAPVPRDALELATGDIQVADTAESRKAALHLLVRARGSYGLQSGGRGYDLKVSFTVDSGGQTDYDGAWKMEDRFDPAQGLLWSAEASAGYRYRGISGKDKTYFGSGTSTTIPLRLQEVRAALFNALADPATMSRASIRTVETAFNGAPVTCILVSGTANSASADGRQWDETEECVDRAGLLRIHSQIPGRYFAYEYSNDLASPGMPFPAR